MLAGEVADQLDAVDPPPAGSDHAAVRPVGEAIDALVGWEDDSTVVLLLPPQGGACPTIELRNLDVLPRAEVLLRTPGEDRTRSRLVAVIRCRLSEPGLRVAFENIAAALCSRLEHEGVLDLAVQIPSLERLFSAFDRDSITTIIGLWAELVLIVCAADPIEAAAAWHGDPRSTFDFRAQGCAMEVKASRDAAREHWVSLDQGRAAEHTRCELASFIVAPLETEGGVSITDLLRRADERLRDHPAARSKIVEVAARTLGRDFARATHVRFDLGAALASLRFIPLREVPHGTFDAGVLDARWKSALAHTPFSDKTAWTALAPIG
jgi:hypothetical protein